MLYVVEDEHLENTVARYLQKQLLALIFVFDLRSYIGLRARFFILGRLILKPALGIG